MMHKIVSTCALVLLFFLSSHAQTGKELRASPVDSVHIKTDDDVNIRIHYGRPYLKGRTMGQDVAPMGKVWRTGANEATTFEVDKDVTIQGKKLKAGKYSLYSIPDMIASTIIFNKVWNQWGTNYDESQDALRVTAGQNFYEDSVEQLIFFGNAKGKVHLSWGQVVIDFDVKAL